MGWGFFCSDEDALSDETGPPAGLAGLMAKVDDAMKDEESPVNSFTSSCFFFIEKRNILN